MTNDPYAPSLVRKLAKRGLRLTPRGADLYFRARAFKRAAMPVLDTLNLVVCCTGLFTFILLVGASR